MTVWLPDNITTGIGLHIRDYDRVYVHAGSQTADHLKGISDYPFIDPDYPDYLLNFVNDPLKNGSGYCLSAYRRLTDTLEFNWPTQVTVIGNRLFFLAQDSVPYSLSSIKAQIKNEQGQWEVVKRQLPDGREEELTWSDYHLDYFRRVLTEASNGIDVNAVIDVY